MSRACRPMLQPFLSCRSSTATRRGMSMVMGSASDGVDGLGQTPGDLPPSSSPTPAPAPASDSSSTGVVKAPRPPKEKKAPKQAPPPRIIQVAKPKKERVKDKEDEGKWGLRRKTTFPPLCSLQCMCWTQVCQAICMKLDACTFTRVPGCCWCTFRCTSNNCSSHSVLTRMQLLLLLAERHTAPSLGTCPVKQTPIFNSLPISRTLQRHHQTARHRIQHACECSCA